MSTPIFEMPIGCTCLVQSDAGGNGRPARFTVTTSESCPIHSTAAVRRARAVRAAREAIDAQTVDQLDTLPEIVADAVLAAIDEQPA